MARLTKEKALRICRELWIWLYNNPKEEKDAWPGWSKYGWMVCDCPCCEYLARRGSSKLHCSVNGAFSCPLNMLWPRGCARKGAPYQKWFSCRSIKTKIKSCIEIIHGCESALRKLGKKVITYRPKKKKGK